MGSRSRPRRTWASIAYFAAFSAYLAGLVLWLALGLVPPLASTFPAVRHLLAETARPGSPVANTAEQLLMHADMKHAWWWIGVHYLFSALNLGLGLLLAIRLPYETVPRLLSVAFLGTAATFNAPSHEIFHAVTGMPVVSGIHFAFHVLSGVAYVWAVVLFPDGRLPWASADGRGRASPGAMTAAGAASTLVIALVCYRSSFLAHPPFFVAFFGVLVPLAGIAAQSTRLATWTSGDAQARQQSRLLRLSLAPALGVAVLWCALSALRLGMPSADSVGRLTSGVEAAFPVVFALVPVVLFVAILRYRLWDIDLVLSRTFLLAMLGAATVLVYAGVLAATGWFVRQRTWSAVAAMTVAALAVEPLRVRCRALANRAVFGQNLTPREALRSLTERLSRSSSADELAALAAVVVSGTRCESAEVRVLVDGHLLLAASAPSLPQQSDPELKHQQESALELPEPTLDAIRTVTGADLCVPIAHRGDLLGALCLHLPPGVGLPDDEDHLVHDLAAHAGLLVANAQLAERLARQVEIVEAQAAELARSRALVVAAQDAERRQLERDIHDGAQQELVAFLMHTRAMLRAASAGRVPGAEPVSDVRRMLAETRDTLRQLCSGGLPPVLADQGLAVALESAAAAARGTGLDVEVRCPVDARLGTEIQSAVYFCCREALQNALKHAAARRVVIDVVHTPTELVFSVTDDGTGFDDTRAIGGTGLAHLGERLAPLGGDLRIASSPGRGTRVEGRLPLGTVQLDSAPMGALR